MLRDGVATDLPLGSDLERAVGDPDLTGRVGSGLGDLHVPRRAEPREPCAQRTGDIVRWPGAPPLRSRPATSTSTATGSTTRGRRSSGWTTSPADRRRAGRRSRRRRCRRTSPSRRPARHPRGIFRRYLAEGVGNAFFDTELALFNAGDSQLRQRVRPDPAAKAAGERTWPSSLVDRAAAGPCCPAAVRIADDGAVRDARRIGRAGRRRPHGPLGCDRLRRPRGDGRRGRRRRRGTWPKDRPPATSRSSTCCRTPVTWLRRRPCGSCGRRRSRR